MQRTASRDTNTVNAWASLPAKSENSCLVRHRTDRVWARRPQRGGRFLGYSRQKNGWLVPRSSRRFMPFLCHFIECRRSVGWWDEHETDVIELERERLIVIPRQYLLADGAPFNKPLLFG